MWYPRESYQQFTEDRREGSHCSQQQCRVSVFRREETCCVCTIHSCSAQRQVPAYSDHAVNSMVVLDVITKLTLLPPL